MAIDDVRSEWHRASELTAELVEQWRDLYRDSISPNVYLSPDFVLTALATFHPSETHVGLVRSAEGLQALAVLERKGASSHFPLPSLKLFKSVHSLRSGLLLRRGIPDATIDAFLRGLLSRSSSSLYLQDFCLDTESANRILDSARRQNLTWYETRRYERAALRTATTLEEWKASLPRKRRKEVERIRRRLEEQGEVAWRLVVAADITDETIETFLTLESEGWKGEEGGALLSDPKQAAFFREVVKALKANDEVFFAELLLDGAVIASTVNFKSRDTAFAFKVAWKQALAKFSPGILNEVNFVAYVASHDVAFELIDSGTAGTSYIDAYWPERLIMYRGYLLRGRHLRALAALLTMGRNAKRAVRTQVSKTARHVSCRIALYAPKTQATP